MDEIPTTVRRWLRSDRVGRRFDYDRGLLPNSHLRTLEPSNPAPEAQGADPEAHYVEYVQWLGDSGMSMGYPSWNLLYYSMISSLLPRQEDCVVVETGTNRGLSTIVMAQALDDLGIDAVVETVDFDAQMTETARRHVGEAGLGDRVSFHTGDSIGFLAALVERVPHLDFVFLDDAHDRDHVVRQMDIVCPKVAVRRGKVYFDNAGAGGVAEALPYLKRTYGGNLVEFANCSMSPSGNAIWQPD
jgi:predicted O-methyltransferase YrrM